MVRNTGACKSSGSGASIDRGVLLIMQDQMPWHFLARCEPQIELRLVAARNPTKFFLRDPENLERPQVWAVRQGLSESDEAYAAILVLS
jgi:hypothetical protein